MSSGSPNPTPAQLQAIANDFNAVQAALTSVNTTNAALTSAQSAAATANAAVAQAQTNYTAALSAMQTSVDQMDTDLAAAGFPPPTPAPAAPAGA